MLGLFRLSRSGHRLRAADFTVDPDQGPSRDAIERAREDDEQMDQLRRYQLAQADRRRLESVRATERVALVLFRTFAALIAILAIMAIVTVETWR